ncbi:MAG: hypothetical protein L3J43_00920 [Sulfurovum sp.]|nr:hypothetical protein [Sulfurovum sp.]
MNQTKKRLTIINLAISITDMETIQLQVSKLSLLKSDLKIGEIISALSEQNYAQTQRLISEYLEAPNETVLQRTSQDEIAHQEQIQQTQDEEEQAIIKEFDLFTTPAYNASGNTEEEVNYDAFLDTTTASEVNINKEVNYDTLLNVVANDILPNNIDLDISTENKETQQNGDHKVSSTDTQLDTEVNKEDNDIVIRNEKRSTDTEDTADEIDENGYSSYEAISHISTKFNNLYNQYSPIEHTENRYKSVEDWLLQISTKGYTESEVEIKIKDAEELKHTNVSEAAQLLIATGATDSLYALFQLARALFVGDILQKNIPEAVTLIHYLAINEEYPEAMCDLAQFYEKGIEVKQNSKKAEVLYKEAMNQGIKRATQHYQRIQKENTSIFTKFKNKL